MKDLLAAEILKLRSTRTALGLLVAAVLVSIVPTLIAVAVVPAEELQQTPSGGSEVFAVLAVLPAMSLVPMLALVFGILSMTNEYRHGTITYTYLATPHRGQVVAVKLAVCAAVGAAVMLLALVISVAVALIGMSVRDIPTDLLTHSGVSTAELLRGLGLMLVTTGLLTSFGVGIGALIRHQVATVAGTLIWALAVENIIVGLKPDVGKWLPFTVMTQVASGATNTDGEEVEMFGEMLSSPQAFALSLAYIALVSVVAVFTTMRRDIT